MNCEHSSEKREITDTVQSEFATVIQTPQGCEEKYLSDEYVTLITQFSGDIVEAFSKIDYACAYTFSRSYAIVSVRKGMEARLFNDVKVLIATEYSGVFFPNALSPINTANISLFHENPLLNLRGSGVLVGILDSGIDYLNIDFMTEDDRTRIVTIWDQSVQTGPAPGNYGFGTEYNREQINLAIQASLTGGDPYAIVNHRDDTGHGTAVASIVGGRGRGEVVGGAPDCEFVIVKLKQAKKSSLEVAGIYETEISTPIYETSDILLGMNYLAELRESIQRPMVILIPLGSNYGGHDGGTAVERYIDVVSLRRGLIVVTGTGNEGAGEGHASGILQKTGDIQIVEINVDPAQKGLAIFFWAKKPDKVSVGIIAPSGESVERIPIRRGQSQQFKLLFEQSTINVDYFYPENITGDIFIRIFIKDVKPGVWQLRVIGEFIANGRYDLWLSSRVLLSPQTRFLNPDPLVTLQIPATGKSAIVTATYNQDLNILYPASGKGFTRDGRIKPDLTSGGVDVLAATVGGGTATYTGSSMAAAVLASAVTLILQWGIVEGNDPNLYARKVRTYLIRGTRKRPGDVYPNEEWGYGILDLENTFNVIRNIQTNVPVIRENKEEYVEVFNHNVHNRIPPEIINRLL